MQIPISELAKDVAIGAVAGGVSYAVISKCSPKVSNYIASFTPVVGTAILMPAFMEHASPNMVFISSLYGGVSVFAPATCLNRYRYSDARLGSIFIGLFSTLASVLYRN